MFALCFVASAKTKPINREETQPSNINDVITMI